MKVGYSFTAPLTSNPQRKPKMKCPFLKKKLRAIQCQYLSNKILKPYFSVLSSLLYVSQILRHINVILFLVLGLEKSTFSRRHRHNYQLTLQDEWNEDQMYCFNPRQEHWVSQRRAQEKMNATASAAKDITRAPLSTRSHINQDNLSPSLPHSLRVPLVEMWATTTELMGDY